MTRKDHGKNCFVTHSSDLLAKKSPWMPVKLFVLRKPNGTTLSINRIEAYRVG